MAPVVLKAEAPMLAAAGTDAAVKQKTPGSPPWTVKNTFVVVVEPQRGPQLRRQCSEPMCFSPSGATKKCLFEPASPAAAGQQQMPSAPAPPPPRMRSFTVQDVVQCAERENPHRPRAQTQETQEPFHEALGRRGRLSSSGSSTAESWGSKSLNVTPREPTQNESFLEVVDHVRSALAGASSTVVCVEAVKGIRGWTITAYVQPDALKRYRAQLLALAKQALLHATFQSRRVFVLGYAAEPFSPMQLGFGAAISEVYDESTTCWSSYAKGFCDNPSSCRLSHPKNRVGVHVMLKPSRNRT